LPLPRNDEEVNDYLTRLGEAKTATIKLVNRANEKILAIQDQLADDLVPLETELAQVSTALFTYWERNVDELTDHGRRQSREYATGVLGQRLHPPRTQIHDEKTAIAFIIKHNLTQFIEIIIKLLRNVMLANQALAKTIPGVSFVQDRTVYAQPHEFDVEVELGKRVMAA
jgi:phage host-nuclease inhibitor protein Gam